MKTRIIQGATAGAAAVSLLLTGSYVATAGVQTSPSADSAQPASSSAQNDQSQPAYWHLVVKILTTKTACENALRVMPNSSDFKCLKAGKVHVIIPKGMGW